jgi:hypothetical protein
MADKTQIDSSQLRTIADAIGNIAQDTSAFQTMQGLSPNAGKFDAATWLVDIYTDRRDALYQHGMDLKQTFHDMSAHLRTIADDYDNADQNSADGVAKLDGQISDELSQMNSEIGSDTANPVQPIAGPASYDSGDNSNASGDKPDMTLNSDGTIAITGTDGQTHTVDSTTETPNVFSSDYGKTAGTMPTDRSNDQQTNVVTTLWS